MSKGTYTMLKPNYGTPGWLSDTSAFYYAFGTANSVAKYKKASATIILPTDCKLKGTGKGRNAYISLGVNGGTYAVDIGIRNRTLPEEVNGIKYPGDADKGFGWEPYCFECGHGDDPWICHTYPDNGAPAGTTKAKVEIVPDLTTRKSIELTVQWLDANNRVLGTFDKDIPLDRTYDWNNFYRFASLVTEHSTISDGTRMLGGGFDAVKLGRYNWGISTRLVSTAWIMNPPKCQLPYGYWDTGEEFRINHRA